MGIGSKFGILAETGNNIQTGGLVFYVDAVYKKSYPGTGTNTFNLASGSLTPTGSLVNNTGFVGLPTSSFTFDGTDDYINCGTLSSFVDNKSQLSIDFWFKLNDTGENRWAGKFSNTERWISLGLNSSGLIYFLISNSSVSSGLHYGGFEAISSGLVAADTWYYLAFIFDGTQTGNANRCKIYLNADSKTLTFQGNIPPTTFDFTTVTNPNWKIGGDGYASNFDGNIATFNLYDRALTAADVLQNYQAQKGRFGL